MPPTNRMGDDKPLLACLTECNARCWLNSDLCVITIYLTHEQLAHFTDNAGLLADPSAIDDAARFCVVLVLTTL